MEDDCIVIAVTPDDESRERSTTEEDESSESGNSSPADVNRAFDELSESDPFDFDDTSDAGSVETNMTERIEFLTEKRSLLKRAFKVMAQEETYDAATAVDTIQNPKVDSMTSIWTEAKVVLSELEQTSGDEAKPLSNTNGRPGVWRGKKNNPNPMDPNIDVSSVRRLIANRNGEDDVIRREDGKEGEDDVIRREDGKDMSFISSIPSPLFGDSQWMAQALVYGAPTTHQVEDTSDCGWQVVSDPFTYSSGLVPPSSMSMQNAVDIEEAIAFTEEPRLVTQSTPRFCIVYVNRAFLMLANLPSQDSLIGQPIESLIQVTQDMTRSTVDEESADDDHADRYLDSVLSRADNKACRIQVVPVLDKSQRRRVTATSYSCMSHFLIRVQEGTGQRSCSVSSTVSTTTPDNKIVRVVEAIG
jgi:hypothetical protein